VAISLGQGRNSAGLLSLAQPSGKDDAVVYERVLLAADNVHGWELGEEFVRGENGGDVVVCAEVGKVAWPN
jgi:hypothetical protein